MFNDKRRDRKLAKLAQGADEATLNTATSAEDLAKMGYFDEEKPLNVPDGTPPHGYSPKGRGTDSFLRPALSHTRQHAPAGRSQSPEDAPEALAAGLEPPRATRVFTYVFART